MNVKKCIKCKRVQSYEYFEIVKNSQYKNDHFSRESECKLCKAEDRKNKKIDPEYENVRLFKHYKRRCRTCSTIKTLDKFPKIKDRYSTKCDTCKASERRVPKKPLSERKMLERCDLVKCAKCKKIKGFDEFYSNPSTRLGIASRCKSCLSEDYYKKKKKNDNTAFNG